MKYTKRQLNEFNVQGYLVAAGIRGGSGKLRLQRVAGVGGCRGYMHCTVSASP
jgi:hypothetical protein